MPVLGSRGKLWLRREAPDIVVLSTGAVHYGNNSVYINNQGYWSGDEVSLTCALGLPINFGDGVSCPDGHAFYAGSDWLIGSNRSHVLSDEDAFYADESDFIYLREDDVGLNDIASFFIYRDQLDRISFYLTQEAALRGSRADRVPLEKVDFGSLLVSPWGTADYQNALLLCAQELDGGDYQNSDIQDEVTLQSICDTAPTYQSIEAGNDEYDNADVSPRSNINRTPDRNIWTVQGDLREWSLNLTSQEVDTTALGERYGESIKALVTGGGTFDFLVSRRVAKDHDGFTMNDSSLLLRLLMMTEKGCSADAQFWMVDNQEELGRLLPGDLFYETRMMITSVAINTRAGDLIAGSANFVTIGQIDLKAGTN